MSPHPALLRDLRDAMRQATHDLDNLKLNTAKDAPRVAHLRRELRVSLFKDHARFCERGADCCPTGTGTLRKTFARFGTNEKVLDAADFLAAGLMRYRKN